MKIGKEFGLDPWRIREEWSETQGLLTLVWINQQLNKPGITEDYLMQLSTQLYYINCSIRNVTAKAVDLKDFKISYSDILKVIVKRSAEEVTRSAKSVWCGAVGLTKVQV